MSGQGSYIVRLDPAGAITNRVELDLNGANIAVDKSGVDWGDAAVSQYVAQQRIGEAPVSFRIPNRVITIPLFLGAKAAGHVADEEEARRQLEQKVGLLQRQGGVLLRQRPGAEPLYADIVDASLQVPDVWGEGAGVEPNVVLKLTCLPDFYGDEIELEPIEDTGQAVAVLEQKGTLKNLIPNPSFEYDTSGTEPAAWAYNSTGSAFSTKQVQTGWAASGIKSLRLITPSDKAERSAYIPTGLVPVVPGKSYTLFCTYKVNALASASASIKCYFLFLDEFGVVIGSAHESALIKATGEANPSITAVAPANAATALPVAVNILNPGTGGVTDLYVDKIYFGFSGHEYFDGDTAGYHWLGIAGNSQSAATEIAVIKGDYPARSRIVLTEKAKQNQKGLLWGVRSSHYDPASTAGLYYDATALTGVNGAVIEAHGETYSGKWLALFAPEVGMWHPFLSTDVLASKKPLTHVGSYRVWGRCLGTAGAKLRLSWGLGSAVQPINNEPVTLGSTGDWEILDFGEIRLDELPIGEHWWRGYFQTNGSGTAVAMDRIWLQPVDDGAGKLRATQATSNSYLQRLRGPATTLAATSTPYASGVAWTNPVSSTWQAIVAEKGLTNAHAKTLQATNFAFGIGSGLTIFGIMPVVVAYLYPQGGNQASVALLCSMEPYKAGQTQEARTLTYGYNACYFGGGASLWNESWSSTKINASTFGVALSAENLLFSEPNLSANAIVLVTEIYIWVFYGFAATGQAEDAVLYSQRQSQIRYDGSFREDLATTAFVPVSTQTGDLHRLPPSGMENRAVQIFLKNSRGDLTPSKPDSGIDKIQAQVLYRPCYIGRL